MLIHIYPRSHRGGELSMVSNKELAKSGRLQGIESFLTMTTDAQGNV